MECEIRVGKQYQGEVSFERNEASSMMEVEDWCRKMLGSVVCSCQGQGEQEEIDEEEVKDEWIDWLLKRPALFYQQPGFVPAFTLDRFVAA